MSKPLPGDENTLLHTHPYNLNSPLEKDDPGEKKQNHILFDITLNLEPYMTPGYLPIQDMKLIGIISHQGTKDNGHHTAMTKKEDEWTLYNDAITTQATTKHIHQTQAYILMYRKTEESTGIGKSALLDKPKKLGLEIIIELPFGFPINNIISQTKKTRKSIRGKRESPP